MIRTVVLIHEKHENEEWGFRQDKERNSHEPMYRFKNPNSLTIYSWGVHQKLERPKVDVIFDVTKFVTAINGDIKNKSGLDKDIQQSIMNHPRYEMLVDCILDNIYDVKTIAFVCNHGKHRSVGWAEIIKEYYCVEANIKHLDI